GRSRKLPLSHAPARPRLGNIAFDQLEVAARLAYLGGFHHSYRHTFCRHTPSAPFRNAILRVIRLTDKAHIRLRLGDHTQPFAKTRWPSTNNIRTGFGGDTSHHAIYLSFDRR